MAKKTRPGRLRIVAGKWRSRLLDIAAVDGLRPTAERIRETLFNWLAPTIAGSRCLDLCAGTGALGFEALSRGAESVVFVEKSPIAARTLRKNAEQLDAAGADREAGRVRASPDAADRVALGLGEIVKQGGVNTSIVLFLKQFHFHSILGT